MEEFRVPQQEVAVEMTLRDGKEQAGLMFVPEVGLDTHPEPLVNRLNDGERFMPFVSADTFQMVNKSCIVMVRLRGPVPRHDEDHALLERGLCLELHGGLLVEGSVRYLMPHERSRLIDFLNMSPRFIEVLEDNLRTLVNSDFVLRIMALSSDPA